jgi:hypothetical protein
MSDIVMLTAQPIRLTGTATQELYLAVDVSAYDLLDLQAVCTVEGTASSGAIKLISGMQFQTNDGWFEPSSNFAAINGTGVKTVTASVTGGFMRYVRWQLTSLGGASAITFFIKGLGRRYA